MKDTARNRYVISFFCYTKYACDFLSGYFRLWRPDNMSQSLFIGSQKKKFFFFFCFRVSIVLKSLKRSTSVIHILNTINHHNVFETRG